MQFKSVVYLLSIVVCLNLLFVGVLLALRFHDTNARRNANAHVWHAVICAIEKQVVIDKRITQNRKHDAIRFYDRLLVEDVRTSPCGLLTRR